MSFFDIVAKSILPQNNYFFLIFLPLYVKLNATGKGASMKIGVPFLYNKRYTYLLRTNFQQKE